MANHRKSILHFCLTITAAVGLATSGSLLPVPPAYAAESTVKLVKLPESFPKEGGTFTAEVLVSASDMIAGTVELKYDPARLEVVDANPQEPGVQVDSGGWDAFMIQSTDTSKGLISYSKAQLGDGPGRSFDNELLFKATFKVKPGASGPHGLSIGEAKLVNSAAKYIGVDTILVPVTPDIDRGPRSSGGGSVSVPQHAQEGQKVYSEEQIRNALKEGMLHISLADNERELVFPPNLAELMSGSGSVSVVKGSTALVLPFELFSSLAALLSEENASNSRIVIRVDVMKSPERDTLLEQAQKGEGASIIPIGDVVELQAAIQEKDGSDRTLPAFPKPVKLVMTGNGQANPAITNLYFLSDNGALEYVKGRFENGRLHADLHHFSKYALLQYSKAYSDVPQKHWAQEAIRQLSAKKIVKGVSETNFAPEQSVTRAEFAALLVRMLGLTSGSASVFQDVTADKWYYTEVNAAAEAGIVTGASNNRFIPDASITREEMVTMLIRAYAHVTGKSIQASIPAAFADKGQVAEWALPYVDFAAERGFVEGREGHLFVPSGQATRAESVQILMRLINNGEV
ncbi:S-layer homology domain-containing protein [Paenibacillus sp. NPDC056579]|uniref:S-layer homology domain-containing protein n=1 Tax=Paenibacillus sp. NPDC056579 TaxID=3345871 RepID=UPI003680A3E2